MNFLVRKPQPTNSSDLAEPLSLRLLRHRVRLIDELLAGLPEPKPNDRSYGAQEAEAARSDLAALKRVTLNEIDAVTAGPDVDRAAANERMLDKMEDEELGSAMAFIEKLRSQGDHRQARIHLLDLIEVRAKIAERHHLTE